MKMPPFHSKLADSICACFEKTRASYNDVYGFSLYTTEDADGILCSAGIESEVQASIAKFLANEKEVELMNSCGITTEEAVRDLRWDNHSWRSCDFNGNNRTQEKYSLAETLASMTFSLLQIRQQHPNLNVTFFCSVAGSELSDWIGPMTATLLNPKILELPLWFWDRSYKPAPDFTKDFSEQCQAIGFELPQSSR